MGGLNGVQNNKQTNKKRNMLHIILWKASAQKEFSTLSDWTCSPTQQTTAHVSAAVNASSQSETSSLSIASKNMDNDCPN